MPTSPKLEQAAPNSDGQKANENSNLEPKKEQNRPEEIDIYYSLTPRTQPTDEQQAFDVLCLNLQKKNSCKRQDELATQEAQLICLQEAQFLAQANSPLDSPAKASI